MGSDFDMFSLKYSWNIQTYMSSRQKEIWKWEEQSEIW